MVSHPSNASRSGDGTSRPQPKRSIGTWVVPQGTKSSSLASPQEFVFRIRAQPAPVVSHHPSLEGSGADAVDRVPKPKIWQLRRQDRSSDGWSIGASRKCRQCIYPAKSSPDSRGETSVFADMFGLILSHLAATIGAIRTVSDIFLLALITIAFEVYSDAVLTSGRVSRTVADPVTAGNTLRIRAELFLPNIGATHHGFNRPRHSISRVHHHLFDGVDSSCSAASECHNVVVG